MELSPRQAAFLSEEMAEIENSERRLSSEQAEARRIREKAEAVLTE